MKIRTAVRHAREGCYSLVRNGWMSFASISTIAISLFILGVFLLLALNVNSFADQIERKVEIRVFLQLDIKPEQLDQLTAEISQLPEVKQVTFVSKAEGLEQLKEQLGQENAGLLDDFEGENNPLYDALKVEVNEPQTVPAVADKIEALNKSKDPQPIAKLNYGQGAVENLFKVTTAVRNVGLVIVAGLAVTAVFLIANTIKITIINRRREISIMKLVGATNSFIRWPFFIEGALLGLIGSLIPLLVILYGYSELLSVSRVDLGLMGIKLLYMNEVGMKVTVLMLALGVVMGIWGSTISIRKYLKV